MSKYRLKAKNFHFRKNNENNCYKEGDLVKLTESQYEAFKDHFEPHDANQKAAAAEKKANAESEKAEAEDKAKAKAESEAKAEAKAKAEADLRNKAKMQNDKAHS